MKEVAPVSAAALAEQGKALLLLAKENPWRMFTSKELALIVNVSEDTLTKIRASKTNPFCAGKCRPETLLHWFTTNPGWQPFK